MLAKWSVDETKYKEPGARCKTEANDGFADNNPESLFHDDEIRNLGGGDIPRSITPDKLGEQQPGVFVSVRTPRPRRASSARCAAMQLL